MSSRPATVAKTLEVMHGVRPDLLLLDVWMPGINGFEVLDQLATIR